MALPQFMLRTAAWRSLRPVERAAYIEAASTYNGSNNGFLAIPARRIADELGIGKSTAARALRSLIIKGFLEVTRESAFSVKHRKAAEYRLTHRKCDRTGALPSRAYQLWRPAKNANHGAISDRLSPTGGTVSEC